MTIPALVEAFFGDAAEAGFLEVFHPLLITPGLRLRR